jgi:hypothetical protein
MINYKLVTDNRDNDYDCDHHMNTALVAMFATVLPINNMKLYTWYYEPFIQKNTMLLLVYVTRVGDIKYDYSS